jgi:AraC-like DNA-binding protein/mannose-6-phosphate isomerase-like protein (cupin superfamily)
MAGRSVQEQVQRSGVLGNLRPRRSYVLDVDTIRPVIRIAHQLRGPLNVPRRIIVDHELVLILAGSGTLTLAERRFRFAAHQVLLIPPFVPHQFDADQPCEHLAIHFDWTPGIPVPAPRLDRRPPYQVRLPRGIGIAPCTALPRGHRIASLLLDALRVRGQGRWCSGLEASNRLAEALIGLIRQHAGPTGIDPRGELNRHRLERAIALLHEQLAQPLRIPQLAQACGLSPAYFRRQFGQWTGYAPREYLRRLRIAKARELLGDVALSVKQVSAQVGFDDPYYFSRSFRQIDGLSPSEFRAAALAGRPG